MENIYPTELSVSPFVIGPGHKEATILVGPQALAERGDNIVRHLYGPLAEAPLHFPVFAQISTFKKKIVLATTVRTAIPDPVAGRQGQKLSMGAWISPEIFIGDWESVCVRTFDLLSGFLQTTAGKRLEDGGGDVLVSRIQENAISLNSPLNGLEQLLKRFAAAFWLQSRDL